MSQYEQDILKGIRALGKQDDSSFIAVVENNYPDKDYVDVKDLAGTRYPDVRKRAAIESGTDGIIITPVTGSTVIVTRIGKGDEFFISMFSAVDRVVIDGGEYGGLIKIQEQVNKLNALVKTVNTLIQQYNAHTHSVATTGSASSQMGTASATTMTAQTAQEFKREDYENEKVKH
jgi:hypothetical protein